MIYHFESGQNYGPVDAVPLFLFLIPLARHQMQIECTQGVNFDTGAPATAFKWVALMRMACECHKKKHFSHKRDQYFIQ